MVENLLKKRFGHKYEFFSAGVAPISLPSMDPRSLKFLDKNNANHGFHTPKKINTKMLDYFDKFLAVDFFVLNRLNISYPKYKYKFASLTMEFNEINIIDPYHFEVEEYMKTMKDIKYVAENISLDKFL